MFARSDCHAPVPFARNDKNLSLREREGEVSFSSGDHPNFGSLSEANGTIAMRVGRSAYIGAIDPDHVAVTDRRYEI